MDTTRYQQWVGVDYCNTFKSDEDATYDQLKNYSEGMYSVHCVSGRQQYRRFG